MRGSPDRPDATQRHEDLPGALPHTMALPHSQTVVVNAVADAVPDADAGVLSLLAPARAAGELGWLGTFRILQVLGQGGMGVVFLAEDTQLGRQVALKVMRLDAAAHPEARQRFLREARAAAAIEHEHVAAIHQVGEDRGVPFLVLPLLRGESLEDRLQRPPASDLFALLIDLESGKEVKRLKHTHHVTSAEFAPDGDSLLTLTADQEARLWDLRKAEVEATFEPQEAVRAVFCNDGRTVALAGPRGVTLWTPHGRRPVHAGAVQDLGCTPDGKTLVWCEAGGAVRCWDVAEGKARPPLPAPPVSLVSSDRLLVSPDGSKVAVQKRNVIAIGDLKHQTWIRHWRMPDNVRIAWGDGRHLAVSNPNGSIYVLRLPE